METNTGKGLYTNYFLSVHSDNDFMSEGIRIKSIDPADYGLTIPSGVAIDSTDSMYIAEREAHKIVKLSEDAKLLKTNSSEELSSFLGATIVGDEIMVCNCKNECIHMYTTDLEYVRQIDPQGKTPGEFKNNFCDIAIFRSTWQPLLYH